MVEDSATGTSCSNEVVDYLSSGSKGLQSGCPYTENHSISVEL